MAASIPKELIEKWKSETATKTERDFEMDLWTEDSANRIFLKELIERMENPAPGPIRRFCIRIPIHIPRK